MSEVLSEPSQSLLDEFIDRIWLEEGLARNTLDSYRQDLSQFAVWLQKQLTKNLAEVSQGDIQQYLAYRFPTSKPRSVSRLIASLRRLYRFALRENKISIDPYLAD